MKTKPIPILYVIASLNIGGTELQLKLLVEGLDRTQFQPIICAITMGGPLEEDFKKMNVPVYVLGKKHKLDISILTKLSRLISIHKPLILQSFMFTANFWCRWAGYRNNIPILITSERSVDTWKSIPYWRIDRLLNRYTTKIIANAEAVKINY